MKKAWPILLCTILITLISACGVKYVNRDASVNAHANIGLQSAHWDVKTQEQADDGLVETGTVSDQCRTEYYVVPIWIGKTTQLMPQYQTICGRIRDYQLAYNDSGTVNNIQYSNQRSD